MLETIKNFIFNEQPVRKTAAIKKFKDLTVEQKEILIARMSFNILEVFLDSGSCIVMVQSYYSAIRKQCAIYHHLLDESETRTVLQCLMHQIIQGLSQVYINSLLFEYYKNFYHSTVVNPKLVDKVNYATLSKIINASDVLVIMDVMRLTTPYSKMLEENKSDAFMLNKVVDLSNISTKLFSFSESTATTFSRQFLRESIANFVEDFIQILRNSPDPSLLITFYSVFAVCFNERFSKLFYKEEGICYFNSIIPIHAELLFGLAVYEQMVKDIDRESLDFNTLKSSFNFNEESNIKGFRDAIKKDVFNFIDKSSALLLVLNGSAQAIKEEEYGVNVVSINNKLNKQSAHDKLLRTAENIKGKLL